VGFMGVNFGSGDGGTLLTSTIVPYVNDPTYSLGSPWNPVGAISPTPSALAKKSTMPGAGTFALMTQVLGGINSAVGGYYAAQAQQYQAKSQAVNLGYQSAVAAINARQSEFQAESDIKAGQSQIFNTTLAEGQAKASATVSMAARGLRGGTGTTADVIGSMDLVKAINVYNINSNAVQAASASRVQATNDQNASNLDAVSAANATRSANSVSPFMSGFSSLLTSASSVANQWNTSKRLQTYLANGGYMGAPMGGFN
jgi:hypothetical protein